MMEEEMRKEVNDYFQRLLWTGDSQLHSQGQTVGQLMELKLSEAGQQFNLQVQVTPHEIETALFFLSGNKVSRLDGFLSPFFKNSWDIVGDSVLKAVQYYFQIGQMPK